MDKKEVTKYNVVACLIAEQEPKLIATKLDVPYATVLRHKRDFETAKEADELNNFVDMDSNLLREAMVLAIENSPEGLADSLSDAADSINDIKNNMDKLQDHVTEAANVLVVRLKTLAIGAEDASEVLLLTDAITKLYTAFFNKQGVQMNVQNNFGEQPANKQFGDFLDDKPKN